MAASSGSLGGGDDSSKLDALAKSIAENSEKLEILNKILGKIEDAGSSDKKKDNQSTTDFLKNIEKIVSKEDLNKARSESKKMQVDADRLASNTFRASETVISEVLSRLGGTSFYPVLSAFRVARESVATATGTPQSELEVTDILKFVNDSTKELVGSFFGLNRETKQFSISAEQAAQDMIDIEQALKPMTTTIIEEISSVLSMTKDEFNKLSIEEDIPKLILYIEALRSIGEATEEQVQLLDTLYDEIKGTGVLLDSEMEKNLRDTVQQEKERYKEEAGKLQSLVSSQRKDEFDEQQKAFQSSRTVAGIAGLAVPIGFLINDVQNLASSISGLTSSLTSSTMSVLTNPSGTGTLGAVLSPVAAASQTASSVGSLIGLVVGSLSPLGPIIGGPIGSFVGKALTDTLLAPLVMAANTLVSINDAVNQIADDLIGFSPEVTGAVIGRELSILQDDFRRAQQIGPAIARITEAQTRLQLVSRQAFDNFLQATEPYLVAILNAISNGVEIISDLPKLIADMIDAQFPGMGKSFLAILKMAGLLDTINDKLGVEDPLDFMSLAYQEPSSFFKNNPGAAVQLMGKP
jgi:hypothetical protein